MGTRSAFRGPAFHPLLEGFRINGVRKSLVRPLGPCSGGGEADHQEQQNADFSELKYVFHQLRVTKGFGELRPRLIPRILSNLPEGRPLPPQIALCFITPIRGISRVSNRANAQGI